MLEEKKKNKRNFDGISGDNSSDGMFDGSQGSNKCAKDGEGNKQPSDETGLNSDICGWIASLNDRIKKDRRIGFPRQQPSIQELKHGWLMEANKEVLHALIKPDFKCIIELGSWLGRSANFIAKEAPNAVIFAVDLWDNSIFENDTHYSKCPMFIDILANGPIYQQFLRNTWDDRYPRTALASSSSSSSSSSSLKDRGLSGIVPMHMDSCAALRILKEIGVTPDLIYVDANHHYQPVLDDVSLSVELFPDAQILGDDWHYEDVRRAVREVATKHNKEIYIRGSHCWTYSKQQCDVAFCPAQKSNIQKSEKKTSTTRNGERSKARSNKIVVPAANAKFADLMKAYGNRK